MEDTANNPITGEPPQQFEAVPAAAQPVQTASFWERLAPILRSPWTGIAAIIVIFLVGSLVFSSAKQNKPAVFAPTPTPTTMPSPTPQRTPSAISSQSAFQTLDASVQSLTNDLGTLTIQDPSLAPPVLDLPLGL